MALQTKTKEPTIRPLSSFPEWKAASEKLNALRDRAQALDRQSGNAGALVKESAETFEADVKGYLASGVLPDPEQREKTNRTQRHIQTELRVLRRAIEIVEGELHRVTVNCSRKICAELVDGHRERASKFARTILAIMDLNQEEVAFGEELQRQGITRTADVPPLVFFLIGQLSDSQAAGAKWIEEMTANGALDKSDPSVRALAVIRERQAERISEQQARRR
jgi:hypothetical protein